MSQGFKVKAKKKKEQRWRSTSTGKSDEEGNLNS